jgi:hypothetical protein
MYCRTSMSFQKPPLYNKLDKSLLGDGNLDVDTPQGTKTDCAFAIQHRRPQLS